MTEFLQKTNTKDASRSLIVRMAQKLSVEPDKLWATLCQTCFKPEPNGRPFSNEEVMYVLMVAEQLDINPLRRELWAFRGKNGVVQPLVSVDGWKAIMLRQPNFDGYAVTYADSNITIEGVGTVPEWAECTIWLKNLSHPSTERVYTQEVLEARSPVWRNRPRQMLHHRALIQAIRFSFPVTGISDVGVTENGEVIDFDDVANPSVGVGSQAMMPKQLPPMQLSVQKLEDLAQKAVALARSRHDYAPAIAFVRQRLTGTDRDYVLECLKAAQAKDSQVAAPSSDPDRENSQ